MIQPTALMSNFGGNMNQSQIRNNNNGNFNSNFRAVITDINTTAQNQTPVPNQNNTQPAETQQIAVGDDNGDVSMTGITTTTSRESSQGIHPPMLSFLPVPPSMWEQMTEEEKNNISSNDQQTGNQGRGGQEEANGNEETDIEMPVAEVKEEENQQMDIEQKEESQPPMNTDDNGNQQEPVAQQAEEEKEEEEEVCQICCLEYNEDVPQFVKMICPCCGNYRMHHRCWYKAVKAAYENTTTWVSPCCKTNISAVHEEYRKPPRGYRPNLAPMDDVLSVMIFEDREQTPLTSPSASPAASPAPEDHGRADLEDGEIREPPQVLGNNSNPDPQQAGNRRSRRRRHRDARLSRASVPTDNNQARAPAGNDNQDNRNNRDNQPLSRRNRAVARRRRRWNTAMAAVYHRLFTLSYFGIIEESKKNKFLLGYISHMGINHIQKFRCPESVINAETMAIATQRIIQYTEVLTGQYHQGRNFTVIQVNGDPETTFIGKVMEQIEDHGGIIWQCRYAPNATKQQAVYEYYRNRMILLSGNEERQIIEDFDLLISLKSLSRFPAFRDFNDHVDQIPNRLPNWPLNTHRIPNGPEDDGEHPWLALGSGYDRKNCFTEIFNVNGHYIGRESIVKLGWSGLRLVQCRDSIDQQSFVSSWYGIQYPDRWHRIKKDFDITVAYWRSEEIINEVISRWNTSGNEETRLYAQSLPAYREAVRIREKYLAKYNSDGSRVGHNHQQAIARHLNSSPNRASQDNDE